MKPETLKHYFRDLIYLIKERNAELKAEKNKSDYYSGIEFGYYEIIELIKSQADSFEIKIDDLGFNDYEKYTKQKK
ncbi:hypothetical protein ACFO3O_01120 [Dokdonia ponticola]|uniref:Uncharacterized protein n=1 Tax=Dokdonia ponticola TaxID=2041041 RepID=A0ABV9HS12_9FLAO